jgi:dihydropteroate synthase
MRLLQAGAHAIDVSTPRVMGIVNVTADSFFDGGRLDAQAAIGHALQLAADGAAIVDVGGESTRPGATPVAESVESQRVIPIVEALAREGVCVSVDTMKPAVMRAALDAGAAMINDVRALQAPGALDVAAAGDAAVCLMHMQGEPRTMQQASSRGVRRRASTRASPPSASSSTRAWASAKRSRIISTCCGTSANSPRSAFRCSSDCRASRRSAR